MTVYKSDIPIKLKDLEPGLFFTDKEETYLAIKSEYRTDEGLPLCYLAGSGETFWGGCSTAGGVGNLMVYPIIIQ